VTQIESANALTMLSARTPRAVADTIAGVAVATVELPAPPNDVFVALASDAIVRWWVRPGVFDTREWWGDVRPGGRWQASGLGRGQPYTLRGVYLEVNRSRELVHTWEVSAVPGLVSTVTYLLAPSDEVEHGTRITLRHAGLNDTSVCISTAIGWETSFAALATLLGSAPA